MNFSDLIAAIAAVIALASLVYARRSATSSADSARAAARSAQADEIAAIQQAKNESDTGRVRVYVSLEAPRRWVLNYCGKEVSDLSPARFRSKIDFERNMLETSVRGIVVNEDNRTVVLGDSWACKGGSTPLWPESLPEPMKDHRGVRIPPGGVVIFESSIGAWTEVWRELWADDDLERLWSHGPSTSLYVWAAEEGDGPGYSTNERKQPASGWEIRIGIYDYALQPEPRDDLDSLIWRSRGRPSFIVTRFPFEPTPRTIHDLTNPDGHRS
ncbi:hypothetical protein AGRA3207_002687 [Actinomadura graeca]|uniref:Secreted protein n=1 Tax=Actinomadura graeca TaxID=2750812 RepID=A0ABX8QSK4_9ACTN|nr:hypothetical protein [Actinomadura graeca]QXJ21794.1 hypothetical protein AGRA3207_002687 [Actinomadura graeca]